MYNLKVEKSVLFGRLSEDFKPWRQPLRIVQRDCLKVVREKPGDIVLQQRTGSKDIKIFLLNQDNQIFQLNEFSTFFMYGKMQESELMGTLL